ncbi:MAG: DUF2807 domain-containing protein [Ignavibacteria bacterium]|nr:DUF2807 domain-containing protein [Ignavibacteria bacterium]
MSTLVKGVGLCCVCVVALLYGCSSDTIGTGRTVEETRDLSSFSAVSISGPMTVFMHVASYHRVVVATDDNVISHITSFVRNDSLLIAVNIAAPLFSTMTVHIYAPNITSIESDGTGAISVPDSLVGNEINVTSHATADIWIHRVTAQKINAAMTSSGDVFFDESKTISLDLNLSGQGTFHAFTVKTDTATVNVSGSGNVELYVNNLLKGVHSGTGQIAYFGSPKVEIVVTGKGGLGGR